MPDKLEIRTTFKSDELDDIVNIHFLRMKIGARGIILRGILRYLEEELEHEKDETTRKIFEQKIRNLKQILGII